MENHEKWKTLLNAFAGQRPAERAPSYPEVAIEDMVQMLSTMDEVTWGMYAFEREALEGKISWEQKCQYIKNANACGRDWAKKIKSEYGTDSPQIIADKMNVEVKYLAKPIGGEIVIFAQFIRPNEITIFTDCIEKAQQINVQSGCNLLQKNKLENILLSHELFHVLEENHLDEIYTQTEKIELWRKPFSNKSKIACLSEIAAMEFAAEMNQLEVSPYMLDVLLTYVYDRDAAFGLYEEIYQKGLEENVNNEY